MEVAERLNIQKEELERKYNTLVHYSILKSVTGDKIRALNELIIAYNNYYNNFPSILPLTEVQKIFEQQYGFDEQKQKILNQLEIAAFQRQRNIQFNKPIWCLVGSSGTGKSTLAQVLAQVYTQEPFVCALGGMSDSSLLTGKEEEIGLLASALIKAKSANPVIILDEIDKSSARVQDSLLSFLDDSQNANVFNHYLKVGLDFSQVTFVVVANDLKKISDALRSRMMVIELPGYNIEQKIAIAQKIVQKWFDQNNKLNPNNFEITPEAIKTLINKTQEKGARQLKTALYSVFDYCLLQWAKDEKQGKPESKIIVEPNLINQLFPHNFANVDQEKQENDEERIKQLQKELKSVENEKNRLAEKLENSQQRLEKSKTKILLLIQRNHKFLDSEAINYQEEIKNATSWEELQVIKDDVLLKIKQKNVNNNSSKKTNKKPNKEHEDLKKQIETLEKKLIENQSLWKSEKSNWSIKSPWFSCFIILLIFVIYRRMRQTKPLSLNSNEKLN